MNAHRVDAAGHRASDIDCQDARSVCVVLVAGTASIVAKPVKRPGQSKSIGSESSGVLRGGWQSIDVWRWGWDASLALPLRWA